MNCTSLSNCIGICILANILLVGTVHAQPRETGWGEYFAEFDSSAFPKPLATCFDKHLGNRVYMATSSEFSKLIQDYLDEWNQRIYKRVHSIQAPVKDQFVKQAEFELLLESHRLNLKTESKSLAKAFALKYPSAQFVIHGVSPESYGGEKLFYDVENEEIKEIVFPAVSFRDRKLDLVQAPDKKRKYRSVFGDVIFDVGKPKFTLITTHTSGIRTKYHGSHARRSARHLPRRVESVKRDERMTPQKLHWYLHASDRVGNRKATKFRIVQAPLEAEKAREMFRVAQAKDLKLALIVDCPGIFTLKVVDSKGQLGLQRGHLELRVLGVYVYDNDSIWLIDEPAHELDSHETNAFDGEQSEFRKWRAGSHHAEARLLETHGGYARLEKSDGTELSIEIEKLSRPDQVFIDQFVQIDFRYWRTSSGRIIAKLTEANEEAVTLELTNGKTQVFSWAELSKYDCDFLRRN